MKDLILRALEQSRDARTNSVCFGWQSIRRLIQLDGPVRHGLLIVRPTSTGGLGAAANFPRTASLLVSLLVGGGVPNRRLMKLVEH